MTDLPSSEKILLVIMDGRFALPDVRNRNHAKDVVANAAILL